MAQEKRVNYFQGMMLVDQDFKDDQNYHRQMRHNHNLELHTWGVVRGLEVSVDETAVTVAEGLAIDSGGREIRWAGGATQPSGSPANGSYLVIESLEVFSDDYRQMKGKWLRVTDTAKFSWKSVKADSDVVLAVLSQNQPDPSVRRTAGSARANGSNIEIRPVTKEGSLRFLTGAPLTERLTIAPTGNIGIGTNDPGSSKLKIATSATDYVDVRFGGPGTGQLEIVGWGAGWNINAQTNEKHLHLNRDSGEKSNVLIGRSGKELFVRGKDGNVGIGTTTPGDGYKLDVAGKVKATGFDGSGSGLTGINAASITGKLTAGQIPDLKDIAGQLPATKIGDQWTKSGSSIYYNTGNVGIGLTNPQNALEVKGNVAIRQQGVLKFLDDAGNWYPDNWIGVVNNIDSTTKWLHVGGVTDAGARRLALIADRTYITGKVGIGIASPGSDLHIRRDAKAAVGPALLIQNGGGGEKAEARLDIATYDFLDAAPNFRLRVIDDGSFGAHVDFTTKPSGSDVRATLLSRLYIKADGNIGIGTNDPKAKLHVDGSIKANGNIQLNGDIISGGTNTVLPGHVMWRPYAPDNTVYFHAWAEDPKPRDTRFAFRVRGDGESPGIQKGYGIVVIDKEGIWGNHKGVSDIRLKKNVSYLDNQTNPTDKLLTLHGVRFRWEDATEDAPYQLGLIAQEVEKVFPELVSTGGDGFKGISILGMFAPVIEAIRQQREEIEELRAHILRLKEEQRRR